MKYFQILEEFIWTDRRVWENRRMLCIIYYNSVDQLVIIVSKLNIYLQHIAVITHQFVAFSESDDSVKLEDTY